MMRAIAPNGGYVSLRIGVDLGGTKIELTALDAAGREVLRRRIATPQGDYAATVRSLAGLVHDAERTLGGRAPVGVGTPGAESLDSGLMKNANSTCLNGMPLRSDVQHALGRDVRMANDANCFALAEARAGAGVGARVVFGVILGTGVGGGIVVDGRVHAGVNRIGGEWGHNPLPLPVASDEPLPSCYCGRRGCVETYLCGPAMQADHRRHQGQDLSAREIAQRADAGDAACAATLRRYLDRLARALAVVINILDPDVVVMGGGLSHIAAIYRELPQLLDAHVFSDSVRTRIERNRLGDSAGAIGAAWLWDE
jgi:fructokinase